MEKLVFVKGPLETLNYFVDCMTRDLKLEYYIFDICKPKVEELIKFITDSDETKVITFNNMAVDFKNNLGQNFWNIYRARVYDYLVDHPRNYVDVIEKAAIDDLIVVMVDRNHQKFVNEYYKNIRTMFLPHGGNEFPFPYRNIDFHSKPLWEKTIDILYVGSNNSLITQVPLIAELPDLGKSAYNFVYSVLLNYPDMTLEEATDL